MHMRGQLLREPLTTTATDEGNLFSAKVEGIRCSAKGAGSRLPLSPRVFKRNLSGYVKRDCRWVSTIYAENVCFPQVPAADFNCLKIPNEVPDEKGVLLPISET